jgi:hypothetical protein
VSTFGDAQAANAAASRRHSNVAPLSGDANTKVAVVACTEPDGPEPIDVSGGVVSAGVAVAVAVAVELGVAVAEAPGTGVGVGGPATGPPGPPGADTRKGRERQLLRSLRSLTRRAPSAQANSR